MKRTLAFILILALSGCTLPSWRVFQAKVPEVKQSTEQREAEKRAIAVIDEVTSPPVADTAKAVETVHAISAPLRASVGEPEKPVTRNDADKIIGELRRGIKDRDEKIEAWKKWAKKYSGKELEETGINLAGPAGLAALVGIIALCVVFPAFGYVLLRALPLLWGFFRRTTSAISEFTLANPDAGEKLKVQLSRRMDDAHKKLVKKKVHQP